MDGDGAFAAQSSLLPDGLVECLGHIIKVLIGVGSVKKRLIPMEAVEKLDEENKLLIEQNAENYQRLISSVDK